MRSKCDIISERLSLSSVVQLTSVLTPVSLSFHHDNIDDLSLPVIFSDHLRYLTATLPHVHFLFSLKPLLIFLAEAIPPLLLFSYHWYVLYYFTL